MTNSRISVNESGRAERILDAAAELLVRWGYQRVTIDDVAKAAGVGKGTVYLHFRSKEALFLTVLLRVHHRTVQTTADSITADPMACLPSRLAQNSYLAIAATPVERTLYLGDPETLGRLAHEAHGTLGALTEQSGRVMQEHFRLLREAGAMRTDLDVDSQIQIFSAVGTGFFVGDGSDPGPDPETRASLLAHVLAASLEVPDPDPAALADVAPAMVAGLQSVIDLIHDAWRSRAV